MSSFLLTRRSLLAAAAGGAVLPSLAAQARAPSLPFVLIGDWGRNGGEGQRAVGQQMGRIAERIKSRFVISVGDNFYENGVTGLADPQWTSSFEEIYDAASLQTRWDVILGNHDYRGDVEAQLAYSARSARWAMPARSFSRSELLSDGTIADFFYIDTNPFVRAYHGTMVRVDGQDTQAQLRWLDTALGRSPARWKIVVGHHPIHTVTGGKRDTAELIAELDPLLRRHAVRIYINGHDHNFQYLEKGGVHYVTNGCGSQCTAPGAAAPGQFSTGSHGFMTADLSAERFAFSMVDDAGATLFAKEILA